MGVFTTGKQSLVGLNLKNPWWLSGASIDLDFVNARYYDSSLAAGKQSLAKLTDYLSISRASTGYAKTSSGTLTNFDNDTLRITDLGLLVEDSRTNLNLRSQDFSTGWGLLSVSQTSGFSAPDGTSTATNIVPDTSTAQHRLTLPGGFVTKTASVPITMAFYAKGNGYNHALVNYYDGASGDANLDFDLSNGTSSTLSNSGWSNLSTSMEAMGSGWYRCIITGASSSTSLTPLWFVAPTGSTGSYAGNGTSGVLFWGMQLEDNAAFPSSYIPTTSASARAADAVSMIGGLNSSLLGSAASIITNLRTADVVHQSGGSFDYRIIGTSTEPNLVAQLVGSTPTIVRTYNNSSALDATLGGATAYNTGVKIGVAWSGAGRSIAGGGGTVATDGSAIFTSSPSVFYVSGSGAQIFAYYRRITTWVSRLADATLQSLTTP